MHEALEIVDELGDGLSETFDRHRAGGLAPDAAARAAIDEFGEPDLIVAAFVTQSPGRRAARVLLGSGPAVGGCWAVTLIAGHAWTWPVPAPLRLAFGLTLLAVISALAVAATARRSYRRTRLGALACLGLITIDGAALTAVALLGPVFGWPLALAVAASATRLALTARVVPRLLTR